MQYNFLIWDYALEMSLTTIYTILSYSRGSPNANIQKKSVKDWMYNDNDFMLKMTIFLESYFCIIICPHEIANPEKGNKYGICILCPCQLFYGYRFALNSYSLHSDLNYKIYSYRALA